MTAAPRLVRAHAAALRAIGAAHEVTVWLARCFTAETPSRAIGHVNAADAQRFAAAVVVDLRVVCDELAALRKDGAS